MEGTSRIKNRGKGQSHPGTPRSKATKALLHPDSDPEQLLQQSVGRLCSSPPSHLSSKDQALLKHYVHHVSGLLSSTDDRTINTYCNTILRMAWDSNLLMNTLLLVSASHLAGRSEQTALDVPHYRHRVLPELRAYVANWQGFDKIILATIIMMSINEVFEANPDTWVTHLKAVSQIISRNLPQWKTCDQETRMLLDIFAYHSVLALIGTNQSSLFMDYYRGDTWSALKGHRGAFLAAADQIISFVAKLSELFPASPADGPPEPIEPSRLARARSLKADMEHWDPPREISSDACNTAQSMRYAGLLYYHKLTSSSLTECDREEILSYCRAIVRHIGQVSLDSPSAASHTWPLYMAGSFLNSRTGIADQETQDFIKERLAALKLRRGVRTIDSVRDRLELVWKSDGTDLAVLDAPLILLW
ncbi:hypothetical protein PV08_00430 [Exophiala spinifera]|uniref:Uncharacterized protein n=1 Tax=Exophiala spinifera TaxID=91928 RepID=A0A0D2BMQ7_9EURO|nr:uncharacterized protein PV08_00430 [Exophiala spinifera]KIW19855.1 hypothetical protein PV08_00430 [Exophiala spinifera]